MKTIWIFFLSLSIGISFWYMNKGSDKEKNFTPRPIEKIKKNNNSPKIPKITSKNFRPTPTVNRPTQKSVIKDKQENQDPQKYIDENRPIIEFIVENGVALAFGDVIIGYVDEKSNLTKGFTELPPIKLWDKAEIPIAIQNNFKNPERVKQAIRYFHENTSIKFIDYKQGHHEDFIVFKKGEKNCLSHLGKIGGPQPILLADGCGPKEIIHEIMHALGFFHEQSRSDRDDFLKINWKNINPKEKHNFNKVPDSFMFVLNGSPFDMKSRMIYKENIFSKNGKKTMEVHGREQINPNQDGLSDSDKERLRMLY